MTSRQQSIWLCDLLTHWVSLQPNSVQIDPTQGGSSHFVIANTGKDPCWPMASTAEACCFFWDPFMLRHSNKPLCVLQVMAILSSSTPVRILADPWQALRRLVASSGTHLC